MAPCFSPSRPSVFTETGEIPPWKRGVSPSCMPLRRMATGTSPGFVPEKKEKEKEKGMDEELVELHSWLKVLYTACRPSEGGGNWDVEAFLRAVLEEKRIVELFDWQPHIAAFTQRFAARMTSSSSATVRRLASLVLKAFFIHPSDW